MKSLLLASALLLSSLSIAANRESGGRNESATVFVEFRNENQGYDLQTFEIFKMSFEGAKARNEVLNFTKTAVGRAGDVRFCVQLQDATQRYNFLSQLAPSIRQDAHMLGFQRTILYAGASCEDFESASEQDINQY